MKLRTSRADDPEINLTSLIDVVLLLLVFFMVSTSFVRETELSIQLPEASLEEATPEERGMEIAVSAAGGYFVNGKALVNNQPRTLRRALEQELGERLGRVATVSLVIRGGRQRHPPSGGHRDGCRGPHRADTRRYRHCRRRWRRRQLMAAQASNRRGGSIYRRLIGYASAHSGMLFGALAANLIYAATDSGFAFLIKPLLDGSFAQEKQRAVVLIPVAVLVLFAIRGVAGFIGEYFMNWVSRQVITRLRAQVFDHYLNLSCRGYDRSSAGEMLSRLTYNIEQVAHSATKTLAVLVRDTLTIVGLFSLMLYLSVFLTFFIAIVAPMIGGLIIYLGKRFRRYNQRIQESMGDVTRVAEEVIAAHRVVKIFNSPGSGGDPL